MNTEIDASLDELKDIEKENIDIDIVPTDIAITDPIKLYIQEIIKYPLLTPEEEYYHATTYIKGKESLKKLNSCLSSSERKTLEKMVKKGNESYDILVNSNLRLVVSVAKRYIGFGNDFLDLIQDGNIGLMKAIYKFEPDKGFRLSTYATWWIKQAIFRGIDDNSRTIRVPVHIAEKARQLSCYEKEFYAQNMRMPTDAEIARKFNYNEGQVRLLKQTLNGTISLDTKIHPDDGQDASTIGDFIKDDKKSPEDEAEITDVRFQLLNLIKTLDEREQFVIQQRYGMDDGIAKTLNEVGSKLGITRERVRQIEANALKKICLPSKLKYLQSYSPNPNSKIRLDSLKGHDKRPYWKKAADRKKNS